MFRKKSFSDELFLHFFCESAESGRFFNYLHDSNSIFWAVDISHPYFNLVEPACSHMLVSVCICCCVHLIIPTYTCWLKIELSENMHASIHINIVTLSKHSQHGSGAALFRGISSLQ